MSDPAIKLFGKTIPLSVNDEFFADDGHCSDGMVLSSTKKRVGKNALADGGQRGQTSQTTSKELEDASNSSANRVSPKTLSGDDECMTAIEEQSDTSTSQEKTLKKPDKILPCPRCNSMDTKFCYFNNYNVNQPRHFCRNCQRYWTAGGTMRNVPVGAGRRKNKSSSVSQHRHVVIPEVFQAPRPDAVNGVIHDANGTAIDMPLCESMASGLNLRDKSPNCIPNGYANPQNTVNQSSSIPISSSDMINKGGSRGVQEPVMKNLAVFPPQVPCIPAPPWHYPLDPARGSSPLPPGYLLPFYPMPPYWGCLVPGAWNMPWVTPVSISPDHTSTSASPSSPTLGKHSRDGNVLSPSNSHRDDGASTDNRSGTKVLVPKTLRVDDPSEAAKSSIWATLGIQKEKGDSLDSRFQQKESPRASGADKSLVLQANPAALSRSMTFQESAA